MCKSWVIYKGRKRERERECQKRGLHIRGQRERERDGPSYRAVTQSCSIRRHFNETLANITNKIEAIQALALRLRQSS
jgi:hypothetical protein